MQFCVISPTAGLELYATRSKCHMVLAQQFLKDVAYAAFYVDRRRKGEFIILDNGAYEGELNVDALLSAISLLKPDVAILPDIICKGWESVAESLTFYYEHAARNYDWPLNWMFIPQGRDQAEWFQSVRAARGLFDRSLNSCWLGLTRFLPTHTCKGDRLIRVKLAQLLRAEFPHTPIHCMGMADGDLSELTVLEQQGIVELIDSSAPVWRGWRGFKLGDDDKIWSQKGNPVDFSASHNPADKELIELNLEAVFSRIGGLS